MYSIDHALFFSTVCRFFWGWDFVWCFFFFFFTEYYSFIIEFSDHYVATNNVTF